MAEIDFDYDFGFDESKDIFKQREEILENYTKHFSSMNVFDHFNLLKQLAPNDRFPELEKCGDAGKKYIKHIEGMIQDYNSGKLKVTDRDLGRFWDVVHAAEVSLGDSRAFKKCDGSLRKRSHNLIKNDFQGLDYNDLEAFSNFPNEEYRPGLFQDKIRLKHVLKPRIDEEWQNHIDKQHAIGLSSDLKYINDIMEQMPKDRDYTDLEYVETFQKLYREKHGDVVYVDSYNLGVNQNILQGIMNNEKHGNEYLAMIQEQNPNFNPEETLAMLNALTAMTKTYEDHQKAEAQNQTTLDSANANTAESAETPTIGQFASQDEINLNENEGQDTQQPAGTTEVGDGGEPVPEKTEITLDDDFKLYLTQNGISLEQYLAEPSKFEDIKKEFDESKNKKEEGNELSDEEKKQQNEENEAAARAKEKEDAAKAAAEEEARKAAQEAQAEEEARKKAEEETKAAEEDARTKQEEDNPVITAEEEKDAPHSKDSDWHTAQEEKVKKYCESNGSSYEIIPTDDHSFAYNLSPSEEKKKEGLTDLTIKHTTPDYMIVNGKDGHIPSVEDFKSLTKDMPEINLGIAEDKYAARLMVAQLENGGQIHNVPKLSKLKDAEPEMIEKLARMKEKSAEEKAKKLTVDRVRELRGLSLAKKAAAMSDEEYGRFKESQEYQKLKEAEEKSGTPQYTDLMDKARLDKDSEEYKKLSDEDKAKVDKVHESVAKLDKNEARKKIMEARGVVKSSRTVERNGEGSDAKVETKLKDNADRNKYNDAMKLIKQNAAERQFR
jgi:GDSL-family lipase/acylhydrolase